MTDLSYLDKLETRPAQEVVDVVPMETPAATTAGQSWQCVGA